MCMYFSFMHNQGEVVHPYKHGPCVVVGVQVSKRIHAISTRTKHDVPWIFCSKSIHGVECSPLATIYEVSHFGSSPSPGFFLSACQRMSFASLGSTKYRCRRGVIGKYHTTFRGAFFPLLYRSWPHTGHVVLSACSPR